MKKWLAKIKNIKHWELYATLILVVIIIGIYLSTLAPAADTATPTAEVSINNTTDYASTLENKLQQVLSHVAGAGKVSVLVMTDGTGNAELAYDTNEKTVTQTGANGQTITTTTTEQKIITDHGTPVILWTNPPQLVGIIVVATGANDVAVRLQLLRAVQTIIGNQNVAIQILNGN